MNSIKRKLAYIFTTVALVCALIMPGLVLPALAHSYPLQPGNYHIVDALNYLRGAQQDDGSIGSFDISAWVVMAIAAAEEDPEATTSSQTVPVSLNINEPPTEPTPTPTPSVGGQSCPINKFNILIPWIALGTAIITGLVIALKHRRAFR